MGRAMKKIAAIVTIAAVHFAAAKAIVAITLSGAAPAAYDPQASTVWIRILVVITKILYFPVITLAAYPRHLFPGNLIYIPMAVNSLLWGIGVYVVWYLLRGRRAVMD